MKISKRYVPLVAIALFLTLSVAFGAVLEYWTSQDVSRNVTVRGADALALDITEWADYENQVEIVALGTGYDTIQDDSVVLTLTDYEAGGYDFYLKVTCSTTETMPTGLAVSAQMLWTTYETEDGNPLNRIQAYDGVSQSNILSASGWRTRAEVESALDPITVPVNIETGDLYFTIPNAQIGRLLYDDVIPEYVVPDLFTIEDCNSIIVFFDVDDSACDMNGGGQFGTIGISFSFEIGRIIP